MNYSLNLHEDRSGFAVCGTIGFDNVEAIRALGKQLLMQCPGPQLSVNLVQVTKIDNVGLALLTAWLRDAKSVGKTIVYHETPSSLQRMAIVCGIEILFKDQ